MRHRDHFRHCRHTDGIGAERSERADLRRRLVRRSGEREVNTLLQFHTDLFPDIPRDLPQLFRIRLGHVGKTEAEVIDVRSAEGIHTHEIDVI